MAPEEWRQETSPLILEYDDVTHALTPCLCLCLCLFAQHHAVLLVITVSVRIEWCGVVWWRESYGDEKKSTDKVEQNKKKKGG